MLQYSVTSSAENRLVCWLVCCSAACCEFDSSSLSRCNSPCNPHLASSKSIEIKCHYLQMQCAPALLLQISLDGSVGLTVLPRARAFRIGKGKLHDYRDIARIHWMR